MQAPVTEPIRQALAMAEQSLQRQEFEDCISRCDHVLERDAVNVPAHLMRGVASGQIGRVEQAIQDLGWVLERQPGQPQATFHLGLALRRNHQFEAAIASLKPLLQHHALRGPAGFETARCLRALGRLDEAIEQYQSLLAEDPAQPDAAANLAMLLEQTSRLDDALNWADRALVLAPANVTAQLVRARALRRLERFEEAEQLLKSMLDGPLSERNRTIVINQLAQSLDRQGRYDEAFAAFERANRHQLETDPEAAVDDYASYGILWVDYLRGWLREHPLADWSETPPDERETPVFLVGFPRSGTTLLDQVLSAHRSIEVIEERELLLEVRRKWMSQEHFGRLHRMTPEEISEARQWYRNARAAARTDAEAHVVVDKLPLNSIYLPLIHRLFPEAGVIFAHRDPRDVVLSCFFQSFALVGAMPYFLDLGRAVAYYDSVMGLATEALEALPIKAHTVRYEAVIGDFEVEARALVEFLELPWDDNVLSYREGLGAKAISTPSYQQVSEPLYRRSAGRWRHYAAPLAPHGAVLDRWARRLGYEAGLAVSADDR